MKDIWFIYFDDICIYYENFFKEIFYVWNIYYVLNFIVNIKIEWSFKMYIWIELIIWV